MALNNGRFIGEIDNKNLLNSTGNSIQYSVITYMVLEPKKDWIYVMHN